MPKDSAQFKCRTCRQSFAAPRTPDGGWHTAFDKKPPSTTCRSHIGSGLCRWEVQKQRRKLWKQMARAFDGRPAAFLTMVPPHRLVAYDRVAEINLENEIDCYQLINEDFGGAVSQRSAATPRTGLARA